MPREFTYDIMNIIKERWSARSILRDPIPLEDIEAIIEAASFAPSCFNEQPWRYIVAQKSEELKIMHEILNEKNMKWAGKAPVLMIILGSNVFERNQKPNSWGQFDTGTSWGFLQLEAWERGYVTHGMAGFNKDKARQLLNIPEEFDIIAMVAMGKLGKKEDLEPMFQATEQPNTRKKINEVMLNVNSFNA